MTDPKSGEKWLTSIVGPTGIGKTAVSIQLAKTFSSEIISADSRQFYKEMTIGTAVPSKAELNAVPHHFIQQASILEDYSVGDFEREAITKIDILFQKHEILFLVGGSGLYLDAVTKGLDAFPRIDPSVRNELKLKLDQHGLVPLQTKLKELDPTYYEKVDVQNPQRVIRALEVCIGSGEPYSGFLNKNEGKRNFNTLKIGLMAPRELIYQRIEQRVDNMIENGLLEEAEKLYPHKTQNALNTVGYKELFQYMDGALSLKAAIEEIKKNTRRFAKRQLTWFRKDQEITWFQYDAPVEEITHFITQQTSPR